MNTALIQKYNIPSPRYTSYPTVPYWNTAEFDKGEHLNRLRASYQKDKAEGLSLYIHLPYCESLCTYCGCNKRITKNHKVEGPYIDAILEEWRMYVAVLGEKPKLAELHLGGGTPTFFSPENLRMLMDGILKNTTPNDKAQFSFEGHPNNTTEEHLRELRKKGFNRVSFGIQDFDPVVQRTINRMQSFVQVRKVTQEARALGYRSINYDLIYGLPKQTMEGMLDTFDKVLVLNPDRIAFYSYAHVPWKSPSQRGYDESDLPDENMKIALYNAGKEKLLNSSGYVEIGMDHFAKPNDGLAIAAQHGEMHRNFMGYTEAKNDTLIGLGVSAISDAWSSLAQNPIVVEAYMDWIEKGELPLVKGHLHSEKDLIIRKTILDLMCTFKGNIRFLPKEERELVVSRLSEHLADNLLTVTEEGIHVNEEGRAFIRTICMALDEYVWNKDSGQQMFSKSV